MDEEITALFQQWLTAFEKTRSATADEETVEALALSNIESRIVATPAEGLRGLVVKLGLQHFLNEHADATSDLAASAYADLIRLAGHDPATEILAKLDSAPRERLRAQLTASVTKSTRPSWLARSRRWGMPIAAALLLAIGAGAVGYLLGQSSPTLFEMGNSEEAWLDAVANQVSLYRRESVASIPVDETMQKTELHRLSEILKLDLSQARLALPGLTLKRVELLQFENRPLAQLLYEGEHGIVALCVMREPGGSSEREAERRANLNTVYWASGDYRFLLVGPVLAETMEKIADVIQSRFAS